MASSGHRAAGQRAAPNAAHHALLAVAFLLAGGSILLAPTQAHRSVLAPLVACLIVGITFALVTLKGRRGAQLDEIGVWYMGTLMVYSTIPLITFLLLGLEFTALNDTRLFALQPEAADVSRVAWLHALYIAAFALAYLLSRPRTAQAAAPRMEPIRIERIVVVAALWLVSSFVLLIPRLFFDLPVESYGDQYLFVQQLPLGLRQLVKVSFGARGVLNILLFVILFSHYRRTRWVIVALVLGQIVSTMLLAGSRTELMFTLATCGVLYHRFVRPVTVRTALAAGALGIVLFLTLGINRALRGVDDASPFSVGLSGGEFEALFANAVDLQDRRARNEVTGPSTTVAISDLAGPIPSQLLPFRKEAASDWYLDTFYPEIAARGGGLAFGVISQAIAGFGALEVVLRGVVTGLIFALAHAYYRQRGSRFWVVAFNCWMIVWAYQSFRATTFYALTPFIQSFLATMLLVEIVRIVAAGAATARPAPGFVGFAPSAKPQGGTA